MFHPETCSISLTSLPEMRNAPPLKRMTSLGEFMDIQPYQGLHDNRMETQSNTGNIMSRNENSMIHFRSSSPQQDVLYVDCAHPL